MVAGTPSPPRSPPRAQRTGSVAGPRAGGRQRAGGAIAAALLAVAAAAALHMAHSRGSDSASGGGLTACMHSLLAVSDRHPLPAAGGCDVAVVLGYALHRNGSCTRPLQSRVEVGVDLFQTGAARHLIFSGAHPGGGLRNVSEANAMAHYAAALAGGGAPPAGRWLLEDRSTSTRTNAIYSLEIIAQHRQQAAAAAQQQQQQQQQLQQRQAEPEAAGTAADGASTVHPWRCIVLVTNPFHQLRSYRTFRRAMLQAGMPLDDGSGSSGDSSSGGGNGSSSGGSGSGSASSGGGFRLYVAAAPFAGHAGYGHPLLDAAADQIDFWRELAALAWYALRGWL